MKRTIAALAKTVQISKAQARTRRYAADEKTTWKSERGMRTIWIG